MVNLNHDKVKHVVYSFFLLMTFAHFFNLRTALIITLCIGVAKEIYDYFSPTGHAELEDIYADIWGIIIGTVLLIIW